MSFGLVSVFLFCARVFFMTTANESASRSLKTLFFVSPYSAFEMSDLTFFLQEEMVIARDVKSIRNKNMDVFEGSFVLIIGIKY